jgi:hypothetical protein
VNYNGSATFTYTISDGNGGSDEGSVSVTITAVNDAPVAVDDEATTNEDTEVTVNVAGNDSDVENNTLTVSAGTVTGGAAVGTITVVSNQIKFTPAVNYNGSATFTYTISDGNGGSDEGSVSVTITAVNDAPVVASAINDVTVDEDAVNTEISIATTFLDVEEGNMLTGYSVTSGNTSLVTATYDAATKKVILDYVANANGGPANITVRATDAGGLYAEDVFTVTVNAVNDNPVVSNNKSSQEVQYSDPIQPVTVTASDLDNSYISLSAAVKYRKGSGAFVVGLPNNLSLALATGVGGTRTWIVSGKMMVAPDEYTIRVIVNDGTPNLLNNSDSTEFKIIVLKEDSRTDYTGQEFASTGTGTKATVRLAATIRDTTALPGSGDANEGDIRNARVRFKLIPLNPSNMQILTPDLQPRYTSWINTTLIGTDIKIGSVTLDTTMDLATYNKDAVLYDVAVEVNGYYQSPTSQATLTLTKSLSDYVTGGGHLKHTPNTSTGKYKANDDSKTNFGFSVKFNKNGSNLQGGVNIIYRSGTQTIQIKGIVSGTNGSLGVNASDQKTKKAVISAKANVMDAVTGLPIPESNGSILTIKMRDKGEPGTNDSLSVEVKNGDGLLLFSTNWAITTTNEMKIGGGNIQVNSGSINTGTVSAARINTSIQEVDITPTTTYFDLKASPNPTTSQFNVKLESPDSKTSMTVRVIDLSGKAIEVRTGLMAGQTLQLGANYRPGMYFIELTQGDQRRIVKVVKQPD